MTPTQGKAPGKRAVSGAAASAPTAVQVVRTLVVWCQDWPVVAAAATRGLPPTVPTAVIGSGGVLACSAPARNDGVRRGLRRREAQARCPELVLFTDDPGRDARLFEPVALVVEDLVPGIEVVRPGLIALPARGPARYFGGELAAAEQLVDQVGALAGVECQVGVADGLFAATLAAHRGVIVPPGGSPEFLAPLSVTELDQPAERRRGRTELVGLLRRLGLSTLGAFAGIPLRDVASRFGTDAMFAHRLASGLEERPPARRAPPVELAVSQALDPPVDRVDAAAFAARALAERLHTVLVAHGLAGTRLGISARTENGEELSRVWRCAEPLTAVGIADRVRWQLDGWLKARSGRPTAGLVGLRVEPLEVVDAGVLQLDLWKGADEAQGAERAGRALVRVQGLLGPDAVLTPVLDGGRAPIDRVRLVPWGDELQPTRAPDGPWPGRLPAPSPSLLPAEPVAATVRDAAGVAVGVTGRHLLTGEPHWVTVAGAPPRRVLAWAGPWPADERWWSAPAAGPAAPTYAPAGGPGSATEAHQSRQSAHPRRSARVQVLLAERGGVDSGDHRDREDDSGELAMLLACEGGAWRVEGVYE